MKRKPSLLFGLRLSIRMHRLILAIWIVPIILLTPFRSMISATAGQALRAIPEGFTPPAGDIGLFSAQALLPVIPSLGVTLLSTLILMWFWTVLWHAGLCRQLIWEGETSNSLSRTLGHGIVGWWSYLRLSLWAWLMFLLLFGGIGAGFFALIRSSWEDMNEDRMVVLIPIALGLLILSKIILWAATLRGAWELTAPGRRSSVFAWFRGLRGALAQPLATLLPTLVFGILIAGCLSLPLLLYMMWPQFRTGRLIWLVLPGAGLVAACLQLWLFAAMAPISPALPLGSATGIISKNPSPQPSDMEEDSEPQVIV